MKALPIAVAVAVTLLVSGCRFSTFRCESRVPKILEIGKRYEFTSARSVKPLVVRIEDIDGCSGWVRVRRADNYLVTWVNMSSVESVIAGR